MYQNMSNIKEITTCEIITYPTSDDWLTIRNDFLSSQRKASNTPPSDSLKLNDDYWFSWRVILFLPGKGWPAIWKPVAYCFKESEHIFDSYNNLQEDATFSQPSIILTAAIRRIFQWISCWNSRNVPGAKAWLFPEGIPRLPGYLGDKAPSKGS